MVNSVHARALSVAAVFLGLEVPDKVPRPPELDRLGIKEEVRDVHSFLLMDIFYFRFVRW